MMVMIYSFASKFEATVPGHVKPEDVYDCRILMNPWFDLPLRSLDGKHQAVRDFVENSIGFTRFMAPIMISLADGKTYAFFCVGGQHRSVVCAEALSRECERVGLEFEIEHRALGFDPRRKRTWVY